MSAGRERSPTEGGAGRSVGVRLAEFQVGITCGQNSVLTHFSTPRFALRFVDFWSPSFHLLIFLSRRPTETPNYFWNSRPPSCRYPVKAMRTTLRPYTRPPSNYEWPGAYDPHSGPMCRVVWGEGVGRSGAGEYRVGRFSMPGNNLIRCVFRLKKGTLPSKFPDLAHGDLRPWWTVCRVYFLVDHSLLDVMSSAGPPATSGCQS